MRLFGREFEGSAKALVILVAVLLVSAGMCGLQLTIANEIYNSSGAFGPIMMLLGILELIAMLVSLIGIAIVLVSLLVTRLFGQLSLSTDQTGRVFQVTSQMDEPHNQASEESRGSDEDTTR
jgi:hypothetical protein